MSTVVDTEEQSEWLETIHRKTHIAKSVIMRLAPDLWAKQNGHPPFPESEYRDMTDHPADPKEIWVICYTSRYGNRIAWEIHDTKEQAQAALIDDKVYPPWQQATLRHYVLDERPAAKPKVGRRKG